MSKKICFLILCICIGIQSFSQKVVLPDSLLSKVIVTVDTAQLKTEEFLWFYNKYNSYIDSSLALDLQESMDLFIEYKMKIIEAEHKQLDTTQKFKDEFYSYIKSTSNSYLFNSNIEEQLLKLEYERLKTDYKIQQIFIRSFNKSNPKDTLAAYQKALKLKKEILAGADFEKYAREYSEDNFTKDFGGNLGYITSTLLPLEYENAVYNSQIGDIIGPISTEFGYYISKILDKRPTKGIARASIIVIYPETKDEQGWQKSQNTIDSIYNKLQAGESFEILSDTYNTNSKLKSTKGDIGWLDNAIKYDSKMKEAIFSLQSVGNFTQPLKFDYGFVICKLTNREPLPSYNTYYKIVAKSYKNDNSRKNLPKKTFYNSYKKQTNYKENNTNITEYIGIVDNSILLGKWEAPKFKTDKVLFTFSDSSYSFSDFTNYLSANQKDKKISDKEILIRIRLQEFAEKMLEQHAIRMLPITNKDFAMVMQEYHDGMIIYELLNTEIFQKSSTDSVGLLQFYNNNKDEYLQNEGLQVTYYYCKNDKIVKKLIPLIKKQQVDYFPDQFIMNQLNKKEMDNVIRDTIIYFKGENQFIDSLTWQKGSYHILGNNKVLVMTDIIPIMPFPFEKCKNQVINDYQNYLETEWLYYLHKKYTYTLNQSLFSTLKDFFE